MRRDILIKTIIAGILATFIVASAIPATASTAKQKI